LKTIVALVDLSDLTFKVLKQVHKLGKAFDSQVIMLHVDPKTRVLGTTSEAGSIIVEPSPESVQMAQAKLRELMDSLAGFGLNVTAEELRGSTAEEILRETKRLHADLIILGSHRHGAFYNLLIRSVTYDVLRQAHCPVLVVPDDDAGQKVK
jgi:nucleotide-binding universal stress UspA family protein